MSAVLIESCDRRSTSAGPLPPTRLALYRPAAGRAGGGADALRAHRPVRSTLPVGRRPDATVYRRRRLLAAGLLLLAVAAVVVLAQLIQAGIGGGPLTATGAAAGPGMIQAGATEYVVRSGDTLWSIAATLEPGRDTRPLVDQLAREIGSASLYPGEVIPIPAAG